MPVSVPGTQTCPEKTWPCAWHGDTAKEATIAAELHGLPSVIVPRPSRTQPPGETFHATARGVRRQPTFLDDLDYTLYLRLLGQTAERCGWVVLAYCLMPNHLHLLVRLTDSTLSRGMHRQQGLYARRFNERHGLSGHVFEARFHAVHVTEEPHYLKALRYIVQNPVRAGLCDDPAEWLWSSHRAVAGLTHAGSPVSVIDVRALFDSGGSGLSEYVAFVMQPPT